MDDNIQSSIIRLSDCSQGEDKGEPIYEPKPFDVLLGRGRGNVNYPGNYRLQVAIDMHKDRYNDPNIKRAEKMRITLDIVNFVKNCGTQTGRFLRYNSYRGCWFEVDDETARLKVGNQLRYTRRRSSSSSSSQPPSGLILDGSLVIQPAPIISNAASETSSVAALPSRTSSFTTSVAGLPSRTNSFTASARQESIQNQESSGEESGPQDIEDIMSTLDNVGELNLERDE